MGSGERISSLSPGERLWLCQFKHVRSSLKRNTSGPPLSLSPWALLVLSPPLKLLNCVKYLHVSRVGQRLAGLHRQGLTRRQYAWPIRQCISVSVCVQCAYPVSPCGPALDNAGKMLAMPHAVAELGAGGGVDRKRDQAECTAFILRSAVQSPKSPKAHDPLGTFGPPTPPLIPLFPYPSFFVLGLFQTSYTHYTAAHLHT